MDKSLPKIELCSSARERNEYENMAIFYSIIIATKHLERAYAQDAITSRSTSWNATSSWSNSRLPRRRCWRGGEKTGMTTETFMKLYQIDCPCTPHRLLCMGVPEPIKAAVSGDATRATITIAKTVQHFITTMDTVKLEQHAVDKL
jgi:ESCRT-I complex subunit VPS28